METRKGVVGEFNGVDLKRCEHTLFSTRIRAHMQTHTHAYTYIKIKAYEGILNCLQLIDNKPKMFLLSVFMRA